MKEGQTATFVCELSHEKMHAVWFKNDAKLHTSRTVVISSEGKTHKLEIREVTLDDISQIRVQVKDLKSTAHLKVLGKCNQLELNSLFLDVRVGWQLNCNSFINFHLHILLIIC